MQLGPVRFSFAFELRIGPVGFPQSTLVSSILMRGANARTSRMRMGKIQADVGLFTHDCVLRSFPYNAGHAQADSSEASHVVSSRFAAGND